MIDPQMGEDPATGSAACALSAYIALRDGEGGKTYKFEIEQGRWVGRDSWIGVKVTLDENGKGVKRVLLAGEAVIVSQGSIAVQSNKQKIGVDTRTVSIKQSRMARKTQRFLSRVIPHPHSRTLTQTPNTLKNLHYITRSRASRDKRSDYTTISTW